MPRNEIAAIVGLVVAVLWLFAIPRPSRRAGAPVPVLPALFVFCVAFLLTWIALRLVGV